MIGRSAAALGAVLIATATAPGAPKTSYTHADQTAARRITLRRVDLPAAFRPRANQNRAPGLMTGPLYCKSADQSDLTVSGFALSGFLPAAGRPYVVSRVSVFRTRRDAATWWARVRRPGMVACLRAYGTKIAPLPPAVRVWKLALRNAAVAVLGYRTMITLPQSVTGAKVEFVDWVFLQRGRLSTVLGVESPEVAPSLALERVLVRRLGDRMLAG